ncbi:hypothetical protein EKO27_g9521 [Xylaria grammica]|uniref:Uncharacterized protein n=1 Tax=Xylaria grammica TaxID=363999 RepID=A0A439CTT3_9PEZI|nr:hypothetical protein EKO27_g9521 [Xylaria grammica]
MPPQSSSSRTSEQVLEAASKRYNESGRNAKRSYIERLPAELKLLIIKKLPTGDCSSIIKLALTGPDLYTLITEHEAELALESAVPAIGEHLMPIATALYELRELGGERPYRVIFPDGKNFRDSPVLVDSIFDIVDRHSGRENRRNWCDKVKSLSVASKCLDFHAVVEYWAQRLASRALEKSCWAQAEKYSCPSLGIEPTDTEMMRFCKALYIFELVSTAFPWLGVEPDHFARRTRQAFQAFAKDVAPWEMQQVVSIQRLLLDVMPDLMEIVDQATSRTDRKALLEHFYSWVLIEGLAQLRQLDQRPDEGVPGARLSTGSWKREGSNTARETPISTPGAIFQRYPEEEDGPKAWWYYSVLREVTRFDHPNWRSRPWYACGTCLLSYGYVFWDRETLLKLGHPGQGFPSLDGMLEYVYRAGVSLSRLSVQAALVRAGHRSVVGACTCGGGRR